MIINQLRKCTFSWAGLRVISAIAPTSSGDRAGEGEAGKAKGTGLGSGSRWEREDGVPAWLTRIISFVT